eukprot:Sspe_Gene.96425::Locus_69125_Transcript_1_1_Confidence_1.000_Length_1154::g.96425::m.96425/K14731/mlhB, chnC; epsilon-lactone hydrolase
MWWLRGAAACFTVGGGVCVALLPQREWDDPQPSPPYKAFDASARVVMKFAKLFGSPPPLDIVRRGCELLPLITCKVPPGYSMKEITVGGIPCLELSPPAPCKDTIIYLHGGGYVAGSADIVKGFAARLGELAGGMRVLAVNYSLAPEHPLPRAIEEVARVCAATPGVKCLAGDSAGGGLVLLSLQALRDRKLPLPACAVAISPFADLTGKGRSHTTNLASDCLFSTATRAEFEYLVGLIVGDHTAETFSPVLHSFRGLPPLYVAAGGKEILLSDATAVAERARREGVAATLDIQPNMCHCFPIFTTLFPEADEGLARIARFVSAA